MGVWASGNNSGESRLFCKPVSDINILKLEPVATTSLIFEMSNTKHEQTLPHKFTSACVWFTVPTALSWTLAGKEGEGGRHAPLDEDVQQLRWLSDGRRPVRRGSTQSHTQLRGVVRLVLRHQLACGGLDSVGLTCAQRWLYSLVCLVTVSWLQGPRQKHERASLTGCLTHTCVQFVPRDNSAVRRDPYCFQASPHHPVPSTSPQPPNSDWKQHSSRVIPTLSQPPSTTVQLLTHMLLLDSPC